VSNIQLAIAILGGMLALIAIRVPIGAAMFVAGAIGYWWKIGDVALLSYLKGLGWGRFSTYDLSVIPLFLLMGQFASAAGLSKKLFYAASTLIGHRNGGVAQAAIVACAAFGAICGSSVATTATFSRAALPELARYRYAPSLATGTVAIGGTLGILIPPSVILVVYAITTEQNIAKLFQAALIPGLLAAFFYCVVIALVVRVKPDAAPAHPRASGSETVRALMHVWPVIVIAIVVVGGIYGGVFTPTEGAAVGAIAMVVVTVLQRTLGWAGFKQSLIQTAETSAMIFIIILGSEVFESFLGLSQLPTTAAELITDTGLSPLAVIVLMMLIYILLGAVMDELAMILLTLPVFFPIISALDFGMPSDEVAIWFGILVLIVVGVGLTAPPIGLNVFVVSSIARDVPITTTYAGVLPFIAADVVRLSLVIAFPGIALAMVRWLN
jgi:C4-dicarboxylate transporter, DctM subunit